MAAELTLRLDVDVVSCHAHTLGSHAWHVVATTSINVVRHDVFASFTPSFHPTRPAAPIHAPHTRVRNVSWPRLLG
jgi:hypothetical protein